ncbi:unnamed protein product [Brassica rapa subsp. trilocularis]
MCTDMVHQFSKISTRTVHGKDEHADMCGQRAYMCTDGQSMDTTDVLCVLTDTHGRPVCADGHPQTRPVCTEQTAHVGQNHPNSPQEGPTATDVLFRISPNPSTKSVKENATKQPAFANPETVLLRKQCCNVKSKTTLGNGYLSSRIDEERSKM